MAMEGFDDGSLNISQVLVHQLRCRKQEETTVLLHPEDNHMMDIVELKILEVK